MNLRSNSSNKWAAALRVGGAALSAWVLPAYFLLACWLSTGTWVSAQESLAPDVATPEISVAPPDKAGAEAAESAPAVPTTGLQAAAAMEEALVTAIAQAEKSVVAIARVRRSDGQTIELSLNQFGRVQVGESPSPGAPEFIPNEYATGVVVGADGLILTANHVLQEDCDYWVATADRKLHRVTRVQGADPRSDLAVLKIDANGLVPVRFGDGSKVKKGQIVVALGNPYAIARDGQASASWGIVANLTRKDGPTPEPPGTNPQATLHQYGTLIQTDARLNLGTSGGALVNLKGEMVGLTISLAAAVGYEQSAGFAMPVDETFIRAVNALKQGSEVEYGFLGVAVSSLKLGERQAGRSGVVVTSVVPGTPAMKAGLWDQDVITHVNGEAIHDRDQFMLAVGKLPAEGTAQLRVERDGRQAVLAVAELSKYYVPGRKVVTNPQPAWRGIRVDHVSASRNFQVWSSQGWIDPSGSVWITDVAEDSPAWKEGLRPDMLVSHVAGKRVSTPKQFFEQVAEKPGPIKLRIVPRDGQRRELQEHTVPADAS